MRAVCYLPWERTVHDRDLGWDNVWLKVIRPSVDMVHVTLRPAIAASLVAIVLVGVACSDTSESEDMNYAAFDICTKFVKDRLKAPSSAKFRNFFEDDGEVTVTGSGDGPFVVRSTVDSENSFGAQIRGDFVCTVRNTGDSNWRLVDLQLPG